MNRDKFMHPAQGDEAQRSGCMLCAGRLVDDLMGNLVADSVGRAYSGKLNRQRWGPIKQTVAQVQEEAGEGEDEEEEDESHDSEENGKENGKQ